MNTKGAAYDATGPKPRQPNTVVASQEQFISQANLVLAQIALAVQELRDAVVANNNNSSD